MEKYGNNIDGNKLGENINNITDNREYIKWKTDQALYSKDIINVYDIINDLVKNEFDSDISDLINVSNDLSEYNKYQIFYYLIENGIYFTPMYMKEFHLDTSNIHINFFIEGLKKGGDRLFFNDNNLLFIEMYKNTNELIKILGVEGFLEQYDSFLSETPSLGKIKKNDTEKAINNYKNIKFTGYTLDKINSFGLYNWEDIIENIFEDSILAKKLFFNLYLLNKKEKQDLENLKVDFLNYDLENDIELTIEKYESEDKSLYATFGFNDNKSLDNNIDLFYSKINEICLLKNGGNEFNIIFMDITARIDIIELTSKLNILINYSNSFEDKNEFKNKVNKIFESYIYFLKKNNFSFNILIFKSNGDNDFDDSEIKNNIFYTGKQLKSA